MKRSTALIGFGLVLILAGAAYFGFYYQAHAPSPFDIVDEQPEAQDFLPLVVPASTAGPGGSAPTLEATPPGSTPGPGVSQAESPPPGLVPDRLVIPALFLDAPVIPVHYKDIESGGETYHQWRVPSEFAAGWQDESALLGLPGNTVLNGHHNAYGMVFKDLVKLSEGDLILVYSGLVEFRYILAAKLLLPERGETLATRLENARWLQTSTDERLTLVTCWPADGNTHRVILVAFPEGTSQPAGSGTPPGG